MGFTDVNPSALVNLLITNRLSPCSDGERIHFDNTHNYGAATFQNYSHPCNIRSSRNMAAESNEERNSLGADDGLKFVAPSQSNNNHHRNNVLARPNVRVPSRGMNKGGRPSVGVAGIAPDSQGYKDLHDFRKGLPKDIFSQISQKIPSPVKNSIKNDGGRNEGSAQKKAVDPGQT